MEVWVAAIRHTNLKRIELDVMKRAGLWSWVESLGQTWGWEGGKWVAVLVGVFAVTAGSWKRVIVDGVGWSCGR